MIQSLTDWFVRLSPVKQAFLATCLTWGVTALGAAFVFFFKTINRKALDFMLGFAGGVMLAASFWSLLNPAIEMSKATYDLYWIPALVGFLMGGAFLFMADKLLPHLHLGYPRSQAEGIKTSWNRSVLLVLAITLHNIPEGLAIGVAYGALANDLPGATLAGAVALSIGIAIQNFPEGLAVSVPLRRDGFSRRKSFFYGQLSGSVEPLFGVLGALAVMHIQPLLPYALSFAAGSMIYVVVEELIPESQLNNNADIATIGLMLGFALMMVLDVALG
jgi:zinc transporter, ZIP family